MHLPTTVEYPIVAVGDLHGRRDFLSKLLTKLRALPEWPHCRVVFLGDFVDRHPDVKGLLDLVLEVIDERPGSTAVCGNHDMALVKATQLDGSPWSDYWGPRYGSAYDHDFTFRSY